PFVISLPDYLVCKPDDCYPVPTLLGDLLLAGNSAAWTLLGAGGGVRALAANGETAAVTNPAVAADVHEPLDVHRDLGAQRAFDAKILFDRLTQPIRIRVVQVANSLLGVNAGGLQNAPSRRAADAEDVGQTDLQLFLTRKIDASNSRH